MFKNILIRWFQSCLIGVGCSLLATAFVGLITPDTNPRQVVTILVLGMMMIVGDLVVSIVKAIPKGD